MLFDTLGKLAGLGLVAAVAVGALLWLLRLGGAPAPERPELTPGYPTERFPDRAVAADPALAGLVATQARLLAILAGLPPGSEPAVWLATFLRELRAIMDTAYRVAAVSRIYGTMPPLEALSAEVARIEADVAAQITRRLLDRDGDAQQELLDARLAALRLCARQLQ